MPTSTPEGPPGQGEVVLLVEDHPAVRSMAVHLLRDLGYRVLVAEHGRGGLDIVQSDAVIDLVFTDVIMPGGISGPELAREARRIRPGLKVLFASGLSEGAGTHERIPPGDRLLVKPYRRADLARMIREVLDG